MNIAKKNADFYNKLKWLFLVLLCVLAWWFNHNYQGIEWAWRFSVLLVIFVPAFFLFFSSKEGVHIINLFRLAKQEAFRVTWPENKQVIRMTFMVFIMVALFSFLLWLFDSGLIWLMGKFTSY